MWKLNYDGSNEVQFFDWLCYISFLL